MSTDPRDASRDEPRDSSGEAPPERPRDEAADDPTNMPFLAHLEELRRVMLQVLAAVGIGAVACWAVSGRVLGWLIDETSGKAIFIKPQGAFMARLKVSIVLGVLLALPFVFYKIWSFVGPGLLTKERKVVLPGSVASVVLFYLGIIFSYFLLTPLMVQVLLGFGGPNLTAQTDVHYLLDLVFTMGLASGLVFQMPLFLSFLTAIGLIRPQQLRHYWRHAVVAIFILAAVLTPADPLSQIVLAVPLLVLYLLSYFLSAAIYRGKVRRREAARAAADSAPS